MIDDTILQYSYVFSYPLTLHFYSCSDCYYQLSTNLFVSGAIIFSI